MQQKTELQPLNIPYKIKLSRRAKHMRLAVYADSSVVLTLPFGFGKFSAQKFVFQKQSWIKKSLNYFKRYKGKTFVKISRKDYMLNRSKALALAVAKTEQWNKVFNLNYNRINIKNQKTRWGSCSKKGNLNFNYKIVHLPEALVDYLVVHELCHLKEFNHSRNFWSLVASAVPNYKHLRRELKNFGVTLS